MPSDDRFSQFPDCPLGNALHEHVKCHEVFYKEYVLDDHNHYIIGRVPDAVALQWIKSCPMRPFLTPYMLVDGAHLMGKGALRIDDGNEPSWELWLFRGDSGYYLTQPRKDTRDDR